MDAPCSLHPTDQTLDAFGSGQLDDVLAGEIRLHLQQCPDCRKRALDLSSVGFARQFRYVDPTIGPLTNPANKKGNQVNNLLLLLQKRVTRDLRRFYTGLRASEFRLRSHTGALRAHGSRKPSDFVAEFDNVFVREFTRPLRDRASVVNCLSLL